MRTLYYVIGFMLMGNSVFDVHAVDVVFPNADGKGDLASPASWNQASIPAPTNRPEFKATLAGATLTASEDISFAGLSRRTISRSF